MHTTFVSLFLHNNGEEAEDVGDEEHGVSIKEEADTAMDNTLATASSTAHEKEYMKCCKYVRVKENIKSAA